MPLWLLGAIDGFFGKFLLYVLAAPARLAWEFLPRRQSEKPVHVFLKMKGGGSLIIAMPSLLGLRRKNPQAEFVLVCTSSSESYAKLTGVFDRLMIVDDQSLITLVKSGWLALLSCFRAALCVDLEPNSILAAVFTMLTCAQRRAGLVKQEQPYRRIAYTDAVSFNSNAAIYVYYDQLAAVLGAAPASVVDCRSSVQTLIPPPALPKSGEQTVGLAAFTSEFAKERMMPAQTWGKLLRQTYGDAPIRLLIFGSSKNTKPAQDMIEVFKTMLPNIIYLNMCGTGTLSETAALLQTCDSVWTVDTGLLHLVRLLGVKNRSFWGPTMPSQRLRPIPALEEETRYRPFICSPCVQVGVKPPCHGHNLCMITMADDHPDLNLSWVRK